MGGMRTTKIVRATISSFSRPSHLKILVLSILFFNGLILPDKLFFMNRAKLGQKGKKGLSLMSLKMFTFLRTFSDIPGVECSK